MLTVLKNVVHADTAVDVGVFIALAVGTQIHGRAGKPFAAPVLGVVHLYVQTTKNIHFCFILFAIVFPVVSR